MQDRACNLNPPVVLLLGRDDAGGLGWWASSES